MTIKIYVPIVIVNYVHLYFKSVYFSPYITPKHFDFEWNSFGGNIYPKDLTLAFPFLKKIIRLP